MRSVKQAVRLLLPVLAGVLALLLSGCSVLGYFMTPDWVEDADLIVVNQNETPVYAITVSAGGGSETTADAGGYALLERGESYGLYLEDGAEPVTVVLTGEWGQELACFPVEFSGEQLVLTYTQGGGAAVQTEEAPRTQ